MQFITANSTVCIAHDITFYSTW